MTTYGASSKFENYLLGSSVDAAAAVCMATNLFIRPRVVYQRHWNLLFYCMLCTVYITDSIRLERTLAGTYCGKRKPTKVMYGECVDRWLP